MNIEAQKMHLEVVDSAFAALKKNIRNSKPIGVIESELSAIFGDKFQISVVSTRQNMPWSVISMYPEKSTMNKIVESIVMEDSPSVVKTLWEKNTSWIIEIDRRTIDDSIIEISNRECTALLIHEVGHIKKSQSVPYRISSIMKFKYAQLSSLMKTVFKDKRYQTLLTLPILDSASISSSIKTSGLREEMYADGFAASLGYEDEIGNVLSRLIDRSKMSVENPDDSMSNVMDFVVKTVDDLSKRKGKLAIECVSILKSQSSSIYMESCLTDILNVFYDSKSREFLEGVYLDITSAGSQYEDECYMEIFGLKKKLKPLKSYEIDYISVEVEKMDTYNDKLLIISYIRSKIDAVEYYISIVKSDKFSRKYDVPHTLEYLESFRDQLRKLLQIALDKKISKPYYGLTIQYPSGYEG